MNIWKLIFLLVSAFTLTTLALAQQQAEEGKSDVVVVKKTARYENAGRQDPFIDLDLQKAEKEKAEEAKLEPIPSYEERQKKNPGIRGMLINELQLQGILHKPAEKVAFFQGADGKAHFIREGDLLFNAKVKKIQADKVVFEEYKRYLNQKVDTSLVTRDLHQ